MRWLLVGRCSPAPPWRTSSTSSSGYWVSDFFQAGSPNVPKNVTIHVNASIHQWEYVLYLRVCDSVTTGTPTEENWPGISSVEEFKSYNFPKYKPQPLINHAPRYCCPFVCAGLHTPVHWLCIPTDLFFFFFHIYIHQWCVRVFTRVPVCLSHVGNPVEHFTDSQPLPSSHEPPHCHHPWQQADSKL